MKFKVRKVVEGNAEHLTVQGMLTDISYDDLPAIDILTQGIKIVGEAKVTGSASCEEQTPRSPVRVTLRRHPGEDKFSAVQLGWYFSAILWRTNSTRSS